MLKLQSKDIKEIRHGGDWNLVFDGIIYETVKARELYNLLVENAFYHNEPGVFFTDRVERDNNAWWAFKLDRTNPCISGDALITTDRGKIPMRELHERISSGEKISVQTMEVSTGKEELCEVENSFLTKKNAEVITLVIQENGTEHKLTCTPDHKVYTRNRGYVEARLLTDQDDIVIR